MTAIDPGILALALSDLQEDLRCWSVTAGEAIHSAKAAQRRANEALERMLHWARLVEEQAQSDHAVSQDEYERKNALVNQCDEGVTAGQAIQRAAVQMHELAQRTVLGWLRELSAAEAWLDRAEKRLARALEQLAAAEAELSSAQWNLSSAESRLRA